MGVVQANNDIRVLESKEAAEIERILYELSVEAGAHADTASESYTALVELCYIFAKASLGYKMKATMPIINTDGEIDLKNARHPLRREYAKRHSSRKRTPSHTRLLQ